MNIEDKVVVITGASQGIGYVTAIALHRDGAKVVIAARSKDKLEELAEKLGNERVLVVQTDVTDEKQVESLMEKTVEQFGRIDVLINNAGRAAQGLVIEPIDDYFQKIIDLNLKGVIYGMRHAVSRMKKTGGGVILNISSMVSFLHVPSLSHYTATKHALNVLSHTARIELSDDNIRVVTVYPGMTNTNFDVNTLTDHPAQDFGGMKIDPPEKVAHKIIRAIRKEPRDQFMGFRERMMAWFGTRFPGMMDFIMKKVYRKMVSK